MGKKQILMMINTAIIIALFCNLSFVSAKDLTWNAGDIIDWGSYSEVTTTVTNIATDTTLEDIVTDGNDFNYNITAYDTLAKNYEYIYSTPTSTSGPITRTFDWEDFADDFLTPDNSDFLFVNYIWDYATNRCILASFNMNNFVNNFDEWRLIEPSFAAINARFKTIFNTSHVLDTVSDPYEPIIHNFTWGTFLNNIDFKIMGRKNLNYALNQFKDTKTKWTFEFDLSNYLFFDPGDGYTTYGSYIVTLEIEYSDGGVLEKYVRDRSYSYTYDGIQREYLNHYKEAVGGLKKAMMPIPLISAIIGLIAISTFVLIKKRKKK